MRLTASRRTMSATSAWTLAALQSIDAGVKNVTVVGTPTGTTYCITSTVGVYDFSKDGPSADITAGDCTVIAASNRSRERARETAPFLLSGIKSGGAPADREHVSMQVSAPIRIVALVGVLAALAMGAWMFTAGSTATDFIDVLQRRAARLTRRSRQPPS